MIGFRKDARVSEIDGCHEGSGKLVCASLLPEMPREAGKRNGFRFVHDDVLEPGAVIGEHEHRGNEEIYLVLEGSGTAILDGEEHAVGPGDMYVCLHGHTHGIRNSADAPMRLLVVCTGVPAG